MKESKLLTSLSIYIVTLHFFLVAWIFLQYYLGNLSLSYVESSLVIILPLFASYTTIIISFWFGNTPKLSQKKRHLVVVYISFLLPTFMVFSIVGFFLKEMNQPSLSVSDFSKVLGAIEAAFGIYVGAVIKGLFIRNDK